ncbi:hypothetical protein ACFY7C_18925 [Streptomyces sp. NPDC012769]|uniref:hypothetical protein n=1 Tax=Streptomyces sp. NPDC012769 TaxID=3364848 RepID=UPI0036BC5521
MNVSPDAPVGVLVVVTGAVLVAAGARWKGRAVRPLAPRRARALAWQAYVRALTRSAELAIAAARGAAGRGEPTIVTVEDVVRLAHQRFGYEEGAREHAAAALRHAYEQGRCAADCVTDAYSSIR